ncbi:MAG: acyloxyacyl hydrolase [Rhodospirillales bacterium]|nr:acyloxyacyl hydrolase [Rhodospirillales bacterium]
MPRAKLLRVVTGSLLCGCLWLSEAAADDPDFISFGAGYFDFNRQKDEGAEFRLEYRSDWKLWHIKPYFAVAGATSGHGFVGTGILVDVYFGRRFVVTPSFGPHFYVGGDDNLDLDYPLQFRSQIEFAYRLDDRSRLGLAVSHYSNASLGDTNPGTETATFYYSVPFEKIFGD